MSRAEDIFHRILVDGDLAVQGLIADFQSENLWLDFKRSTNDGKGVKLHVSDRENLAKAISGFANSDGGVIVWGVDCRRDPKTGADLPTTTHPIEQPRRFVSWLEGAVSSCTSPAHIGVEHAIVPPVDSTAGLVVTFVAQSMDAPLQCIQPTNRLQYYMRAGSNFTAVPHAILAGMFGRRPQPRIAQKWVGALVRKLPNEGVRATSLLSLSSTGRAIARDLYINVFVYPPGANSKVKLEEVDIMRWDRHDVSANFWNLISRETVRVAPGAVIQVAP